MSARFKMWVCGHSLTGIRGSNLAVVMNASCECCMLSELSVTDLSLAQSSPTKCGVSECDHEISTMRRPRPRSRPTRVVELPKHTHTHINTECCHGSWVVFSACAKIFVMSLYISISKSYLTISFLLMISVACDILCCISTTRVELLRVLCLM